MKTFLLEEGSGCSYLWKKIKKNSYLLVYYKLTNDIWMETLAKDIKPIADPRPITDPRNDTADSSNFRELNYKEAFVLIL